MRGETRRGETRRDRHTVIVSTPSVASRMRGEAGRHNFLRAVSGVPQARRGGTPYLFSRRQWRPVGEARRDAIIVSAPSMTSRRRGGAGRHICIHMSKLVEE